ncbi:RNA polymerase sigma factor [Mangrovimicrobium sediminis]|uniref:RNA polymerase sigma factor n=1 Tax=Mangrovimicrobium sediminis TaxID=2562682 RepID=A0A4Z0M7K0_9GAMM|nr:RNA polymerase sigma factor [Haliea sp. SAOS-164]TGD75479.1 RNA polymerase sigma factor [Haliea sp. SAOS-164]
MTTDPEDIIRRAQAGDRDAFSRLVDDHYATMYRFARRFCSSREDAEDVTQQACIKLARSIGQFRFESAFSTWLYRLVINCARDWQRARPPVRESEAPEPAAADSAEPAVMLAQVLAQVAAMGEGYRETVVLVLAEGLTHAEAADVLQVKESTVSWRLHEIRKRLAQQVPPGVDVCKTTN